MLQKARWFVEDYAPYIVGGLILVIALLIGLLAFGGPDEEQIREEVTVEVVTEMIQALGPELMLAKVQVLQLAQRVAELEAQLGNNSVSVIAPNEELGAYSDAGGNFYCFPVQ